LALLLHHFLAFRHHRSYLESAQGHHRCSYHEFPRRPPALDCCSHAILRIKFSHPQIDHLVSLIVPLAIVDPLENGSGYRGAVPLFRVRRHKKFMAVRLLILSHLTEAKMLSYVPEQ
jgi:hypothetical protein